MPIIINSYISFGVAAPEAASLSLTNTGGVLSVTYSYDSSIGESVPETQWESITITGSPEIGNTLTASVMPIGSYTYQWYAADSNTGTNDASLAGETANTLLLVEGNHLGKFIRVEATDVNADTYSSYYTPQVGFAATLEYVMIETDKPSEVMLVFDRDIAMTDASGWTAKKNDANNVVTDASAFENVVTLYLTNDVSKNDIVTVSYDASLGNTQSYTGSLALSSITERIGDNYIDASFGERLNVNFAPFGTVPVLDGNWNNVTWIANTTDGSINLIDNTGADTSINFKTLLANNADTDWGQTLGYNRSTTNFDVSAWEQGWNVYDANSDRAEIGELLFTGFVPYAPFRMIAAIRGKTFGTDDHDVWKTHGAAHFNPRILPERDSSVEHQFMAVAGPTGDVSIAIRPQSPRYDSGIQFNWSARAFIIERVSNFDPRAEGFNALYMPLGYRGEGQWYDWVAAADGWVDSPTYNDPLWSTIDRAWDFDGSAGMRLSYDVTGISGSDYELWVRFKTPTSFTSGETILALTNSHYLRFSVAGVLRYNSVDLSPALSTDSWYTVRLYINGADGLHEVRDASNGIVTDSSTLNFSTTGLVSPMRVGSTLTDTNPYNGKIAFIGIRDVSFNDAEKNNMFNWVYEKVK